MHGISYLVYRNQNPTSFTPTVSTTSPESYPEKSALLQTIGLSSATSAELLSSIWRVIGDRSDLFPEDRLPGLHFFPFAGGNTICGKSIDNTSLALSEKAKVIIGQNSAIELAQSLRPEDLFAAMLLDPFFDEIDEYDTQKHYATVIAQNAEAQNYLKKYKAAKIFIRHWMNGNEALTFHSKKKERLDPIKVSALEEQIKQSGSHVGHPHGNKNVFFVSQWAYHIDLQMAYIGGGIIIIHDFDVADEIFTQLFNDDDADIKKMLTDYDAWWRTHRNNGPFASYDVSQTPERFEFYKNALQIFSKTNNICKRKYQKTVNLAVESLEREGFLVVRVCGILLPNKTDLVNNGIVGKSPFAWTSVSHCCFNLLSIAPYIKKSLSQKPEIFLDILSACSEKGDPLFHYLWNHIEHQINQNSGIRKIYNRVILRVHELDFSTQSDDASLPHFGLWRNINFDWRNEHMYDARAFTNITNMIVDNAGGLRCQTMIISKHDQHALDHAAKIPINKPATFTGKLTNIKVDQSNSPSGYALYYFSAPQTQKGKWQTYPQTNDTITWYSGSGFFSYKRTENDKGGIPGTSWRAIPALHLYFHIWKNPDPGSPYIQWFGYIGESE